MPALLLSIVGYVESISVALTLAAKRRQRIDADQELIALGAANIGSSLSGGFPVTGGLSRSIVNFDAGAETPAAGAFTAIGIALTHTSVNLASPLEMMVVEIKSRRMDLAKRFMAPRTLPKQGSFWQE